MTRTLTGDQDFFESRPLRHLDLHRLHRDQLLEQARRAACEPSPIGDLEGIIAFLESGEDHDSEGRDLGFDKRSFSRNELNVAMKHEGGDRLRYLQYRYRFDRYPRLGKLTEFPTVLAIEPTSICNLRCVMCFQADKSFSEDKSVMGRMDFELFRQVIDEGERHGLCSIILASRGEPLLHGRIADMVAYAKAHGVLDVKLNTNGTQLTEASSRALLAAGLDTLVFSIDSHEAEAFERIRPPAKFDRIVKNIEAFHRIRAEEFPDARTRTRITMVRIEEGQDPEAAARFWQDKVDEFGNRWVIDRLNIYDKDDVERERPCSLLWERLYVWFDGTINPCDEDYRSSLSPGRISTLGSVHAAWHSEAMQRYRALHTVGEKNAITPCDKCHGF